LEDPTVARSSWAVFCITVLLAACVYTVHGLRLEFMTARGQPGAGFFPRIVGVGLILSILYVLVANWRRLGPGRPGRHRSAALFFALTGALFIGGLGLLGTWVAIGLYLFATLAFLNAGRHLVNIAVSLALPGALFLLFDVWLKVPLPEGIIFLVR
jgi:hypothetical protein